MREEIAIKDEVLREAMGEYVRVDEVDRNNRDMQEKLDRIVGKVGEVEQARR